MNALASAPHADAEHGSWLQAELRRLRRLTVASWVEGATLLLLVAVAVPLKYLGHWPLGVQVVGPIHGAAFLTYVWLAIEAVSGGDWSARELTQLVLAAFVPFGPALSGGLLRRKQARLLQAS